ncbi:hypothetical protein ACJX0J_025265 [Zea mays]
MNVLNPYIMVTVEAKIRVSFGNEIVCADLLVMQDMVATLRDLGRDCIFCKTHINQLDLFCLGAKESIIHYMTLFNQHIYYVVTLIRVKNNAIFVYHDNGLILIQEWFTTTHASDWFGQSIQTFLHIFLIQDLFIQPIFETVVEENTTPRSGLCFSLPLAELKHYLNHLGHLDTKAYLESFVFFGTSLGVGFGLLSASRLNLTITALLRSQQLLEVLILPTMFYIFLVNFQLSCGVLSRAFACFQRYM